MPNSSHPRAELRGAVSGWGAVLQLLECKVLRATFVLSCKVQSQEGAALPLPECRLLWATLVLSEGGEIWQAYARP